MNMPDFVLAKGFTLLEVLIAISITALIGLGAWQLLNSAIRTYELGQESLQSLSLLQRTQLAIERDFSQIVPRAIRDEFGDYQAALQSSEDFYSVQLTRAGWRNPLQEKRSELQRVAYELNEGELLRHHWKVLDRAQDSSPVTRRLLEDVVSFEIAYLNDSDAWVDEWPPQVNEASSESQDKMLEYANLPRAVRVVLEHPRYGSITRYFEQSNYLENTLMQANNNGQGDGQDQGQDQNQDDQTGSGGQGDGSDTGTPPEDITETGG